MIIENFVMRGININTRMIFSKWEENKKRTQKKESCNGTTL